MLPIIGAIGGMACPVAVFWLFAHGTEYASGAASPLLKFSIVLVVALEIGNRLADNPYVLVGRIHRRGRHTAI